MYLIIGPWSREGIASTSGTDLFDRRYWLPEIDGYSWLAILITLLAVAGVYVLMRGTRYGLRLKAVGRNPYSARLLGVPTNRYMLSAFAICGALAGVAGTVQAIGFHHKLVPSASGGYGFGSTQLSLRLDVDSSLAGVMQGMLVLFILLVGGFQARRARQVGG